MITRRQFCTSTAALLATSLSAKSCFASQATLNIKDNELLKQTSTPALFARTVSRGRWKMKRHLAILDQAITDTIEQDDGRLIVTMPPRHGKSELCSKYLPAWYLGTFPDRRVMLTSYEAEFASKWGRDARNLLEDHGGIFGVQLAGDSSAAHRWEIAGHGGGMVTAGVGGPITGKGANLLIVDDPVKNAEEANSITYRQKAWDWYQSTAYTRLEPKAAVIVIQTRWHEDDLTGRLLKEAQQGGDKWRVINFPAIANANDLLGRQPGAALWPERYNERRLDKIRRAVGDYVWSALYQQEPRNAEDCVIKSEWLRYYLWHGECHYHLHDLRTIDSRSVLRFVTADCAATSEDVKLEKKGRQPSESVLMSWDWDRRDLVLRNVWAGRWDFPELVRRSHEVYQQERPAWFGVEDEKTGRALWQTLAREGLSVRPLSHEGKDKLTRAATFLNLLERGQVHLPRVSCPGSDNPPKWMQRMLDQWLTWTGHPDDPADYIDPAAYAAIEATKDHSPRIESRDDLLPRVRGAWR